MDKQKNNLSSMPTTELFSLYADLLNELTAREIIRSTNNPVADYAEYLVRHALNLRLNPMSTAGFDAEDDKGQRYEIKARRLTSKNLSTHLSVMRNLDQKKFDYLVGVRFREDFTVERAVVIPYAVVLGVAKFHAYTNAWDIHLSDTVCSLPGVVDITDRVLQVVQTNAHSIGAIEEQK